MTELKPGQTITLFCDAHGTIAEDIPADLLDETVVTHREDLFCYYAIHVLAKVLVERSVLPRTDVKAT